ncbi:MAG: Uma2 family endonuclease [Chitinophagaceae bacterium]
MGYALKILPHYTYNDYVQWEGRWELIEGIPFAMSPAPIPKHQRIAAAINTELSNGIKKSRCKTCFVYHPIDYKVAEDTVVQPDVLIVCGKINKPFLDFPPNLIVEILSPSTALKDRHTKYGIYESEGVKYYIIVDLEKEVFELYQLLNGKYILVETNFDNPVDFNLEHGCTISVTLNEVW